MVGRRGRLTALPEANDFIVEHQAAVVYAQTSALPRRADSSHSTRAKRFLEARPLLSPPLPRDKRFPRISCAARLNGPHISILCVGCGADLGPRTEFNGDCTHCTGSVRKGKKTREKKMAFSHCATVNCTGGSVVVKTKTFSRRDSVEIATDQDIWFFGTKTKPRLEISKRHDSKTERKKNIPTVFF